MKIQGLIDRMKELLKMYFDCQDEIVLAKFEQLLHEAEFIGMQKGYEILKKMEMYVQNFGGNDERN